MVSLAEAAVAVARGDDSVARERYETSISLLKKLDLSIDVAEIRLEYARFLSGLGDSEGAQAQLEDARKLFAEREARGLLERVDRELSELTRGAG